MVKTHKMGRNAVLRHLPIVILQCGSKYAGILVEYCCKM